MNFSYIIVQCGGKGTRLGKYTQNRPKALVPLRNRPLIFHLFEKYPDKNFIVIGDYKYDILAKYLEAFAKVRYIPIRAFDPGNMTGLKPALEMIPDDKGLMIIWSDVLLGDGFDPGTLENGNYVGITDRFSCSWSSENGILDKVTKAGKGVAGCFLFQNRQALANIPASGSFTQWMKANRIPYKEMDMADSVETGTIEALEKLDSFDNRCRPYNRVIVEDEIVIKEGLTPEARELLKREENWYEKLSEYRFEGIPHIHSLKPLTMERIHGDNIFRANIPEERKPFVIQKLIDRLDTMHHLQTGAFNAFDIQKEYYAKTLQRLGTIASCIPFADKPYIIINHKKCRNILFNRALFQEMTNRLPKDVEFGIIHGDGTFTNTLIDNDENIYYIDPRGYFGNTSLIGDVNYDWAKLYYSIVGRFDQFNVKRFELDIGKDEIEYKISPSGWECYEDFFFSKIKDCDPYRIRFVHAVIWLSLASHCWEDFDSMCLAFYNGLYLWNELIEEAGNGTDDVDAF